jgi:filamentous hemagglutinin family protein
MKNKELLNLIKTKSNEIQIKDFSKDIIEKAKNIRYEIPQVKRSFQLNFKPLVLITFSLAIILVTLILYKPTDDIIIDQPKLESMDEVLVFSSLTSATLINIVDQDLNYNDSNNLLLAGMPGHSRVDLELADLAKYLESIEKIFASSKNFDLTKEDINQNGFNQKISFKTIDFLNEENDYEIIFNQVQSNNQIAIDGLIKIGTKQYQLVATQKLDEKQLNMVLSLNSNNFIELSYEIKDEKHVFNIKTTKNNVITEEIEYKINQDKTTRVAEINFIRGNSNGSYQFEIVEENNKKIIKVNYALDDDGEIQNGNITIRILSLPNRVIYSMLIKPSNQMPFTMTFTRMMIHQRFNHQTNNQINL